MWIYNFYPNNYERGIKMRLFDCTLRDGANVVGNGFSPELTVSIVENLLAAGINQIELGNAKGIGSYERGSVAPLDDEGYMKIVAPYVDKGELGMFILAPFATEENVKLAKENGLSFLRIGNNAGDGESSLKAVELVKNAGLKCRYSLMKGYVSTAEELALEAKLLADHGVDAITIMDSAGTMTPLQTSAYVKAMLEKVNIPVGFHGHSNMGLAIGNAMAAVASGAEEVDCGLLGMARSAGNCSTEIAVATFIREGLLSNVDMYKLLHYLDNELIPAMQPYNYKPAVAPIDLILGYSGCHSAYIPMFEKIATKEQVDLYELIVEVSKKDRKKPSEALIQEIALALKK